MRLSCALLPLLLGSMSYANMLSGRLGLPDNTALAGATISLDVAGLSTTTDAEGKWQLGQVTSVSHGRVGGRAVSGHLRHENGRLRLAFDGRDLQGRLVGEMGTVPSSAQVAGRRQAGRDSLRVSWKGRRLWACEVRTDSVQDFGLRLDTATSLPPVVVKSGQFSISGVKGLHLQIFNQTSSSLDSLSLRLFVRSKDTVAGINYLSTSAGLVAVPKRFATSTSVRYDLCQAYDAAGFNLPCDNSGAGVNWSWASLNRGVQLLPPVKLENSLDSNGTWLYAIDLPLGPTRILPQNRIMMQCLLANRSEYGKALSASMDSDLSLVKAFLPARPYPALGEVGWYDAMNNAAPHAFGAGDSAAVTTSWSASSKTVAQGYPTPWAGMPAGTTSGFETNPPPANPYIAVYRKGIHLSGYVPVPGRD